MPAAPEHSHKVRILTRKEVIINQGRLAHHFIVEVKAGRRQATPEELLKASQRMTRMSTLFENEER